MSSTRFAVQDPRCRLAAALLLHHGEISVTDIEALPLVENREMAEMVADGLTRWLGAQRYQKRLVGPIMSTWEDVIRLPSAEVPE